MNALYILHNGEKKGPYPLDKVQAGLDAGQITPSHLAWHEGLTDWVPITQIAGIRPPASVTPPSVPSPLPANNGNSTHQPVSSRAGCLPMIGSILGCLILYVLLNYLLFQIIGTTAYIVMALLVIASIVWVFFDARAISSGQGQVSGLFDMAPWGWIISCVLLWIVAFPVYIVVRHEVQKVNDNRPELSSAQLEGFRRQANQNGVLAAGIGCGVVVIIAFCSIILLTLLGRHLRNEFRDAQQMTQQP